MKKLISTIAGLVFIMVGIIGIGEGWALAPSAFSVIAGLLFIAFGENF